ncbi:hypothetical protein Cgig2_017507 [Carnegiea gigantea]|uniref:Uncharacterized protein n=1 Tax=Carnegiea gigantea TaxID=171969 RepID=A0A9Q1K3D5_9CARY|nr:hypothetical protein Cgig2_017507 [Carnegiea gigantea]
MGQQWNRNKTPADILEDHPYFAILKSYICIELSLEERDAKTDGFQQQYIRQLIELNKEIKMKRNSLESIEGVDYRKIIHESEIKLRRKSAHILKENLAHIEPSASTYSSPLALGQPCPEYGSEREPLTAGPNDPIKVNFNTDTCRIDGQVPIKIECSNSSLSPMFFYATRPMVSEEIIRESQIELQTKSAHMAPKKQAHTEPSTSAHGSPLIPEEPSQECGSVREPPVAGPNDPIEIK